MQTTTTQTINSLADIRAVVAQDLAALDQLIVGELSSEVPLLQTIMNHITENGGKRLRPLLVILSAKVLGYDADNEHHELAAVIEFIHTATLLHDDVVDNSLLRRGKKTANAIWDNQASVLTGDFLYSRAFQILARRDNVPVMRVLADTTNQISEGEMLQLTQCRNVDLDQETYFKIIFCKTAALFAAATTIGSLIATDDKNKQEALQHYGLHFGMAYQIIDDVLDYTTESAVMGKSRGDDLAEGKMTLPLMIARRDANTKQKTFITKAIRDEKKGADKIDTIVEIIKETGAAEKAMKVAREQIVLAQEALAMLPISPYQNALHQLSEFVLQRSS